jgi:hypothetical protein
MYKLILPAFFMVTIASAQVTNSFQNKQFLTSKSWQPPKLHLQGQNLKLPVEDSSNREKLKEMMRQSAAMSLEWQGQFSHHNSEGSSVYLLPKDKMPCLVADKTKLEKMPSGNFESGENVVSIPNGFPKVQVIPNGGKNQ